ncbi:MAG: hypothetical protein WCO52_00400 [bacterium]
MIARLLTAFRLLPLALAFVTPTAVHAGNTIPDIVGQGTAGTNSPAIVAQFGFIDGQGDDVNRVGNFVWDHLVNRVALPILGGLAVLSLIYGGILYITANGSAEAVTRARQVIINSLLAVVVIATAYTLLGAIIGVARILAGRV